MDAANVRMKLRNGFKVPVRLCWIFLVLGCFIKKGIAFNCPVLCVCNQSERLDGFWVVQCTAKNMTSLTERFDPRTAFLDLSLNQLSSIPDSAFSNLNRLTSLSLVSNSIFSLSTDVFAGLSRLEYLFLHGNRLQTVPMEALRGLTNLRMLYLDHNNITNVPDKSFRTLKHLITLRLDSNLLTSLPVTAVNKATRLEGLGLDDNLIEEIPNFAFANLTNLVALMLSNNKISHIGEKAFDGLQVLNHLELNNNRLKDLPLAIGALPDLVHLEIKGNLIRYIPNGCFYGNKKLTNLELKDNPITSVGINAFSQIPNLKDLVLSEAHELTVFPNLAGTTRLEKITLDRSSVEVLPSNICEDMHFFIELDIHSNKISAIPNMTGCTQLTILNLGNNRIHSIDGSPFADLNSLKDLILSYNRISYISDTAFTGLGRLQYLDLSNNRITDIHPNAFAELTNLEDLNLSENQFERLPTKDLENLRHLKTFHNTRLQVPLPREDFPNIQTLKLAYAYQCCAFKDDRESEEPLEFHEDIQWLGNPNHTLFLPEAGNINFSSYDYPVDEDTINQTLDEYKLAAYYDIVNMVQIKPRVQCDPQPDPFQPCDDLFGWWALRCGVWLVFLLAVFGNSTVLFVSLTSKSKLDVTRFLICNLAVSDLCMGIYLGFLAVVDASTLGEFENHAIYWQTGPGCLIAGFLGVLSSELSVFTLCVITIERFYAISHAMQLGKRVRLGQAALVMASGWIFALCVASLPLFKISDYRKFAICLPFDTEDTISLAYVCFIMAFNAVAFIIILICYSGMFVSIRASHSWNSKDTIVAKRMALLVFTDFFCWAPIIFFSLTAALNWHLARISLDEAKVLTIFVLPLNSCANPFLYAFFTRQFKRDCVKLCKRIEESTISRHLSSSGGRTSGDRTQRHHSSSDKHRSCDNSLNEPSTSGEASSSNNPSDDSDLTVRKLPLTREDRRLLRYMRSSGGTFRPVARFSSPAEMSSSENKSRLALVTRRQINPSKQEDMTFQNTSLDEEADSGTDIILHTKEGNIHLGTKPKAVASVRKRNNSFKIKNNKCAQRLCNYPIQSANVNPVLTGVRSVESQTVVDDANKHENLEAKGEVELTASSGTDKVRRMFELERSKELGLKRESFKNKPNQIKKPQKESEGESSPRRTISTQTEMLFQLRLPRQPELSADVIKREKDKHINEWRKTSHLSFLWKNSANFDLLGQKQKSNSLVELRRPLSYSQGSAAKRHSLTSRHEGYILLKNSSRDSAYEEDEIYEFYDNSTQCPGISKHCQKQDGKRIKDKIHDQNNAKLECGETMAICETSVLLGEEIADNLCSLKTRKSCDMESGISSSS